MSSVVNSEKEQQLFATSLRHLYLSYISTSERKEKFSDAENSNPGLMVTTSTFIRVFFPTVSQKKLGVMDGERAWFGIRSIIKGGNAALMLNQKIKVEHFRQLNPNMKSNEGIPRKYTERYFSDDELRNLVHICDKYQKWLKELGRYDDLDIVYRALRHHSGDGAKNYTDGQESFEKYLKFVKHNVADILKKIKFNRDKILFKPEFYNNVDKISKNGTLVDRLHRWIGKLDREEISVASRAGKNAKGVVIYKNRLTDPARIFFSKIRIRGSNHKHRYVIYGFELNHNQQNTFLRNILKNEEIIDEDDENQVSISVDDVDSKDDTPGVGPMKPWPDAKGFEKSSLYSIKDISNIDLDDEQRRTLLEQQPLLIDGLAGTGKTSALAYRSVMRTAFSSEGTRILVLASKSHVVSRLVKNHQDYVDKGKWDPQDPFKTKYFFTQNVSNERKSPCSSLEEFHSEMEKPDFGFDEIILDECQDITYLEFQLLLRLCKAHDARRMIFAGDPLQTLNPTGFDWNRIISMFQGLGNIYHGDIILQQFHKNYRSSRNIVQLANSIQRHRSKVSGEDDVISMIPDKEEGKRAIIIPYQLSDLAQSEAIKTILKNSERGRATVVVWASDDAAIYGMLSGSYQGVKDPLLESIWSEKEDKQNRAYRTQGVHLYSASSIKGDEKDVIVLYNFASSPEARKSLASLLIDWDELKSVNREDIISVRYAFSRLYVGVTRAFDQVYFIENEDGVNFWKNIKLSRENGGTEIPEVFFDFDWGKDPTRAVHAVDLMPSVKASISNFNEKMKKFRQDNGDLVALEGALGLARDLYNEGKISKKELAEVEGEYALIQSRDPSKSKKERDEYLEVATKHFIDAEMFDRLAPIYYQKGDYRTCLTNLRNYHKPFHEMVKFYCTIRIKEEPDGAGVIDLLQKKVNVPQNWVGFVDVEGVRDALKQWCLANVLIKELLSMLNPYSVKSPLFTVEDLMNNQDAKTKIHILEQRDLCSTTKWKDAYLELVIIHAKSIAKIDGREIFLNEKVQVLGGGEYFSSLFHEIRIERLQKMGPIKSPKRGSAIYSKMNSLLKMKNPDKLKSRSSEQLYALWLTIQIVRYETEDHDDIEPEDMVFSEIPIPVQRYVRAFIDNEGNHITDFGGGGNFVNTIISALRERQINSTDYPVFNWLSHGVIEATIDKFWADSVDESTPKFFGNNPTGFQLYVENPQAEKTIIASEVREFILSFFDYSLRTSKSVLRDDIQDKLMQLSRSPQICDGSKDGIADIREDIAEGIIAKFASQKIFSIPNVVCEYLKWVIINKPFDLNKKMLQKLIEYKTTPELKAYVKRELWRIDNKNAASSFDKNTVVKKHEIIATKYVKLLKSFDGIDDGKLAEEAQRIEAQLPMDKSKVLAVLKRESSLEKWCKVIQQIYSNNPELVQELIQSNAFVITSISEDFDLENGKITDEDIEFLSSQGIGILANVISDISNISDSNNPFTLLLYQDIYQFIEKKINQSSNETIENSSVSVIFEIIIDDLIVAILRENFTKVHALKYKSFEINPPLINLYIFECCLRGTSKKVAIEKAMTYRMAIDGTQIDMTDDLEEFWDWFVESRRKS